VEANLVMKKVLVIAGGGSGGHVYPGIAIARAIQESDSEWEIHFVGAKTGMESQIVPKEGFSLHTISVGRLNRNVPVFERIFSFLLLPFSFLQSLFLLIKLQPIAVLGVGGFASGPFVLISSLLGKKTFLWEPNAVAGMANRLLSPFVRKCYVGFKETASTLKNQNLMKIGYPVRENLQPLRRPDDNKFHLFVFGGSQGARSINQVLVNAVKQGGDWLENLEIVHQTGKLDFSEVESVYSGTAVQAKAHEFIFEMERMYAWADLVVCRSGMGTVSEVSACQKAAIFIPLPTAADNHQQKNAEVLSNSGAATLVLQKEFDVEKLISLVESFKSNRQKLLDQIEKVKQFYSPGAAKNIAEDLLKEVT